MAKYLFLVVYWILCSCITWHTKLSIICPQPFISSFISVVFSIQTCLFLLLRRSLGFPIFLVLFPQTRIFHTETISNLVNKPCIICPLHTSLLVSNLCSTWFIVLLYIYVTTAHFGLNYNSQCACFISQIWE